MSRTAGVVVCGAGIAGVSAAYHLAIAGLRDILLLDPLPPLSLTSDRSTECYRNWWPDPAMVALMNRSIDLMEDLAERSGNVFRMNRRGYLYVTGDESRLGDFGAQASRIAAYGAGPLRVHAGPNSDYDEGRPSLQARPSGADLLLDPSIIRRHYPYLTENAVAALHVRRAGWLSAQQLGMYLLEQARALGVRMEKDRVEGVACAGGRVIQAVLASGERIDCPLFVNAAGPYLPQIARMLGVELPVRTELHLKVTFSDHLQVLDRSAPLLIWNDSQSLPWSHEETAELNSDPATAWLVQPLPPGAHMRPEGSGENPTLLMLWDYRARWMEPTFPPPIDDHYPEVALRGLATMVPGLGRYFDRAPRPYVDGGYYVKTPENRLLAGPLPVEGAYIIGGLSGHGIMSSCAAGELVAAHVLGGQLPAYAASFSLQRYDDPAYVAALRAWESEGQL